MRHLFATTALAAALSVAAAQAQESETQPPVPMGEETAPAVDSPAADAAPPAITPPEGYVQDDAALTTETLEGATVYDANGDAIGEVYGLVFADGTTSLQGGDTEAAAPMTDAAPETLPADEPGAATEPVPDAGAGDAAGTAPDTAGTAEGEMASPEAETPPEAAAPDAGTDTPDVTGGTDGDRMENIGSDTGTVTPTDATNPPVQTAPADDAQAMASAEISHAIIDVGGFLGLGAHRVAVPVEDLMVYRSDTDLRIYLPWTREQLEALPEFDEDAPAPATQ